MKKLRKCIREAPEERIRSTEYQTLQNILKEVESEEVEKMEIMRELGKF